MSAEGGIGSFMQGLAMGVRLRQNQDKQNQGAQGSMLAQPPQEAQAGLSPIGDAPSGSGGAPLRSSDPVATDLAPHQRAFLNAISDGESGGKYNVRYTPSGGAEFGDLSRHPGIMERGPNGPSSAAGRYQFTKTTWNSMGGGDFSPQNQDRRAWRLAQSDYKARTGGDLDSDLQKNGLTPQIMKALQPTWTSFGTNGAKHIAAYNDSLARYGASAGAPEAKSIMQDSTDKTPKGGGAMKIMSDIFPQARGIAGALS